MTKESISVIIPCHVFNEALDICLHSLQEYKNAYDELILVLDGVVTDSSFLGRFQLSHLVVKEIPVKSGPAHARNVGASLAKGKLLFFLDSDIQLTSNVFDQARSFMRSFDSPDAIVGSYDDDPSNHSTVSLFRNLMHHYVHQVSDRHISTFWGACGMIKAEVFEEISGFDERFRQASVEDIELGYRLTQSGFNILLCPEMQVKHLKKWTFINMIKTDVFLRARPWTRLLVQYRKLSSKNLNLRNGERPFAFMMLLTFVTLFMTLFQPVFIALFLVLCSVSIVCKISFYRFMANYVPKWKIPLVILLHWTYYLSAIFGFILGRVDQFVSMTVRRSTTQFTKEINR